ncbi:MAG: hypothetical protein LDL50_00510 [Chloroflexi bacterium]|nr:hypothetical protein [Chloroflexota bacterium]MCA2000773.1 hypothetical protein [Chloroflexota bacterium]
MNNKQLASSVSWGVILIGAGVLYFFDWWWPGVMLVVGAASATELMIRGRMKEAAGSFFFFIAIVVVFEFLWGALAAIPWTALIALVLIGMGGMVIVQALTKK